MLGADFLEHRPSGSGPAAPQILKPLPNAFSRIGLGGKIEQTAADRWQVTGVAGRPCMADNVIDCGNSGLIFRFFTAAAALCDGYTVLTGDASIRHIRPIQPLLDGLQQRSLIERRLHPTDRRVRTVWLKPGAEPVLRHIRAITTAVRREAVAGLPPAQVEVLTELLLAIRANLTAVPETA